MAAGTTPIFVDSVKMTASVIGNTANANRDGSGALYTLWTGGADGSRIDWVHVTAQATTASGNIRLWVVDGGGTARCVAEAPVSVVTVAAGVVAWSWDFDFTTYPILLESGDLLRASTQIGAYFDAVCFGGDY